MIFVFAKFKIPRCRHPRAYPQKQKALAQHQHHSENNINSPKLKVATNVNSSKLDPKSKVVKNHVRPNSALASSQDDFASVDMLEDAYTEVF